MTQPIIITTTEQRPTLDLLGSDHPHFRVGARIAAQAERGQLVQLAIYTVYAVAVDRAAGRVTIQTAQGYLFVATVASYDALLAMPQARPIPAWSYTDTIRPPRYFAKVWQQ